MSDETVLVLRTCDRNMQSYNGFRWPQSGPVKCNDWNPEPICGYGLHGLLWGVGDGALLDWSNDAFWIVVRVAASDVVDLGGKVKFPAGEVVFCGSRIDATNYLMQNGGACRGPIVGGTATAGYGGTATAGYRGTATAGDGGTATAGVGGTATAGDGGTATAGYGGTATAGVGGTATAGDGGTATAGYGGTATAGVGGTATAGDGGTATAGVGGTATAGDGGTATAGDGGTATAGYGGTATAGYGGTATAGDGGVISLTWFDGNNYRRAIAVVGENGILPHVRYALDSKGNFIQHKEDKA